MRVACLIPWLVIGLLFPGQIPSLSGQGVATLIHDVSDVADGSVTQARLEAQRQAASGDLAYRSYTKGDPSSFSGKYTPPELPDEKKGRFVYGLALFSDDGCNVTVNRSLIHERMGQGQHLPSIGDSFHVLQTALAPGEPTDITVDYSNIIYDDDPDSPGYPDIDGCTLFLYLLPMAIAVDANRDGTIAFSGEARDITSQHKPFRFWCNDDDDKNAQGTETVPVANPDNQDNHIGSLRDLEDFAKLHIYLGGLQEAIANRDIQVGLEWRNTSGGTPAINVYQAAESDGGDEYVRNSDGDETWAKNQSDGQFKTKLSTTITAGNNSFRFPSWFWDSTKYGLPEFSAENPSRYLLFEGIAEGKGQLVLTFWKGSTPIGEGCGCWLDIKNIKKMYQRIDTATAHPWENVPFEPEPNEPNKDVVVFVHGWRMSPVSSGNFAESMYKRLWHRGFKGRFAAFHWDTWWYDAAGWVPFIGGGIDAYLAYYNDSERIAWQSAAALKTFVNSLPFENKNLVAHSMGNIVTGEALRQGMEVDNYALLHGAVPAASYDGGQHVKQTQQYNHLTFTMWDNETPDDDPDSATRAVAYRGRLENVSGNLINFFLPQDYATSFAWEVNNEQTKPPDGALMGNYQYQRNGPNGQKLFKFTSYDPYQQIYNGKVYLSDPYESMPFACRTWGKAVGAFGDTEGSVNKNASVNLSSSTFNLPGESSGFGDSHSGEFNFRIQQLKPFYDTLMDKVKLERNP